MAEETVDEAVKRSHMSPRGLSHRVPIEGSQPASTVDDFPLNGACQTLKLRLIGAHGFTKMLYVGLIQHFGLETFVAKHLATAYGDRSWVVASLCAPTESRFPVCGVRLSAMYPFVDGEVRYAARHEYAQTAVDVLARRTRLAFLNAQAALGALPTIIDIMGEELRWNATRKEREWREAVAFLGSMGLPKSKLGSTRKDVESGNAERYSEEEYDLYTRQGKSFGCIYWIKQKLNNNTNIYDTGKPQKHAANNHASDPKLHYESPSNK
jgi:glycerol-3-phosphate dehydrogenase